MYIMVSIVLLENEELIAIFAQNNSATKSKNY